MGLLYWTEAFLALGYCCLYSCRASLAVMSSQLTHWLSESWYPFHLMRYWTLRFLPWCWESRIRSTSYSSSPLIRSGGGWVKFGLWSSVSLYGVRRSTWNTRCIFHVTGRVSWYIIGDRTFSMVKSPYHLAASLIDGWLIFRLCPSNHTWSPTLNI